MGFWDKVGDVVSKANAAADKKMEKIEHERMRYERFSDGELKRIYPKATSNQKIAIRLVLKDRGYNF